MQLNIFNHAKEEGSFDLSYIDPEGKAHDFMPYYEEHIACKAEELKKKPLKYELPFPIFLWWLLAGAIIVLVSHFKELEILLVLLCCFVFWYEYDSGIKSIDRNRNRIKESIFPLIFRFFGDDFTYQRTDFETPHVLHKALKQEKNNAVSELIPSGIIPSYHHSYREDMISGTYKGMKIDLFEAELIDLLPCSRIRKNQKITVFQGLFIRIRIKPPFYGQTIIKIKDSFSQWNDTYNGLNVLT